MALPILLSATDGLVAGYSTPHKCGGNFYVVAYANVAGERIKCFKATDPSISWTEQDTGGRPSTGATLSHVASINDGTIIYVTSYSSASTDGYDYFTFDTSTDLWDIDDPMDNPTNRPDQPWASIALRSDGDVIVAYAGATDKEMGDPKERVDYARREGGSWGGNVGIALDAGGDIHYGHPFALLGTNDGVHIFWQKATSTVTDPPVSWESGEGRTLDSGNTLSTVSLSAGSVGNCYSGYGNGVFYDPAGTPRMIFAGCDFTSGANITVKTFKPATEDGSDNISLASQENDGTDPDPYNGGGDIGIVSIVELNTVLHLLFSGGGGAGVDQDVYYQTSTDDGATWSTATEELDAITCNFISANIYVRGTDIVMAYVYDDAGDQKYNEKILFSIYEAWKPHDQRIHRVSLR